MSRDIESWLNEFKQVWSEKDIDRLIDLFADEVDYFETPFLEFESKDELRDEWETIRDQKDIDVEFEVFNSEKDRFAIIWSLSYTQDGEASESKGVYLMKLNSQNKCYEFAQYPVNPE